MSNLEKKSAKYKKIIKPAVYRCVPNTLRYFVELLCIFFYTNLFTVSYFKNKSIQDFVLAFEKNRDVSKEICNDFMKHSYKGFCVICSWFDQILSKSMLIRNNG